MPLRSYKFRLRPTKKQEARLGVWLDGCRELYNACLQERRDHWQKAGISISLNEQKKELPAVKEARPDIAEINAAVLQDVVHRVDAAFLGFFRRVKQGAKAPGYPRFKSYKHYESFTHPQAGKASWDERAIRIPCFGHVKWVPWKSLDEIGKPKTLTIKREADGWYVILACEVETPRALLATGKVVGIDVGLKNLVTTSDGEVLGDLETLKMAEKKLRKAQRNASRKAKGSNRRKKAVQILARRHQDLTRSRKAQVDVISRKLVNENDVIVREDLAIQQLINLGGDNAQGRGIRRNWRHAAVATLCKRIDYKAESAGRRSFGVDPRGTTIDCSGCGEPVPKTLSVRTHICPHCGLVLCRDVNAARNVLQRGLRLLRGGTPQAPSLEREMEYKDPLKREVSLGLTT